MMQSQPQHKAALLDTLTTHIGLSQLADSPTTRQSELFFNLFYLFLSPDLRQTWLALHIHL